MRLSLRGNVNIPHTWNNEDGQDGGDDYYRGTCFYEKTFTAPSILEDERLYIEFNGVNASARVVINGKEIISHDGGYSTFRADITDYIKKTNHMVVEVDNSKNDRVYPQKADFTFYGGIYRDVKLLVVNKHHLTLPCVFPTEYMNGFARELLELKKDAKRILMKEVPERAHTLMAGFALFDTLAQKCLATELTVTDASVRDGYLKERLLKK